MVPKTIFLHLSTLNFNTAGPHFMGPMAHPVRHRQEKLRKWIVPAPPVRAKGRSLRSLGVGVIPRVIPRRGRVFHGDWPWVWPVVWQKYGQWLGDEPIMILVYLSHLQSWESTTWNNSHRDESKKTSWFEVRTSGIKSCEMVGIWWVISWAMPCDASDDLADGGLGQSKKIQFPEFVSSMCSTR